MRVRHALPLGVAAVAVVLGVAIAQDAEKGGADKPAAKADKKLPGEENIDSALRWLARHQAANGGWSAADYKCGDKCDCDGKGLADFDVGVTGLAVLAFLEAGYTPMIRATYEDPVTGAKLGFGEVVKKGLKYLVDQQADDGRLGPQVGELMYNHAIAAYALCEAYGITMAATYKAPAQKAADFVVAAQNPGLGWRYTPRCGLNDTSVTGWCVKVLKSAQITGLKVPAGAFDGAKAWLARVTDAEGKVGYDRVGSGEIFVPGKNEEWAHHPTMSAVGLLCRIFIDKKRKDPLLGKQAALLLADLPKWDPKAKSPPNDFYYWYYSTVALSVYDAPGGPIWKKWNKAVTDALVPNQRGKKDGCKDGSWDAAKVDRWAYAGGRVYATAINALTLEVNHRFASMAELEKADKAKKPGGK